MVVMIGEAFSPIRELSSAISLAEDVLELHCQPHVALDLELAAHEGHGAVELAINQVQEITGRHGDGDVGALGLAATELAGVVGQLDPLLAPTVAGEVELVSGIHARNLRGIDLETAFYLREDFVNSGHAGTS